MLHIVLRFEIAALALFMRCDKVWACFRTTVLDPPRPSGLATHDEQAMFIFRPEQPRSRVAVVDDDF